MTDNTWPEQDAVDYWLFRMGMEVDHKDSMQLKEAVTKPRLDVQLQLEKSEQAHAEKNTQLAAKDAQLSDLKRQLEEKEQARLWHHEQELEAKRQLEEKDRVIDFWKSWAREAGENAEQERAHADALAGALEKADKTIRSMRNRESLDPNTREHREREKLLTAYRSREE